MPTLTTSPLTWLLPLASEQATLPRVGGKGANLAQLAAAGFPVPDGFLITTEDYRAFVAVVVQRMVESEASGVLFTANPLTGLRTETVIDATFGLGEALVSGQVEPDHYTASGN